MGQVHHVSATMPNLRFTAHFPIQKRKSTFPPVGQASEFYHVASGALHVAVDIPAGEIYAVAQAEAEVSAELHAWLMSSTVSVKSYPAELASVLGSLDGAARRVVEAIKYFLIRPDIFDNALGMAANFTWSDGEGEEKFVPIPPETSSSAMVTFSTGGAAAMQVGLDKGYRPLIGMRHLFRAMQESEPRFRWIDITIALELAIKEALIRKHPEIELLILEMPSPPLTKLYDKIMKHYLGEKSPYLAVIKTGMETRNKLLHRPDGVVITETQAADYLREAHKAINHVFSLLYPEWSVAKGMTSGFYTNTGKTT
ncbi:hypothetical protein [Janthinobacterium sp. HH103]|uniref:hypothetical protein n=2 Tax=Janthinobacterium TaxID=29580 RepID=UPI0008748C30|nr:hypothetical protein [Janthinobacterium sp. HH103]